MLGYLAERAGVMNCYTTMAREMIRGRVDEAAAAASLASLIVRWLSPKA